VNEHITNAAQNALIIPTFTLRRIFVITIPPLFVRYIFLS
jgi:hypothetical protein